MGKKRSNLRSSSKGINAGNNNSSINNNCGSASATSSSSGMPGPMATSHAARQQQQQQLMQTLFQGGGNPNTNNNSATSSSNSASAAEKWAWLTEMAVAGAGSSGSSANGIILPGGVGGIITSTNSNSGSGGTMMTAGNASSSISSGVNHILANSDAASAQKYLQSLSQLLASEMSGGAHSSQSGSGSSSNINYQQHNPLLSAMSNANATSSNVIGAGGNVQSIGMQLEALSALMAQQNPTLKISVSSGGGIGGGSSNSTDNQSGKKRSSSSNSGANNNSNNNRVAGKVTVERMANFQQYLNVVANSYSHKLVEQEQKQKSAQVSGASGAGGGGNKSTGATKKRNHQHTVAAAAAAATANSTTTTSKGKSTAATSIIYPPPPTTSTTTTNFNPNNIINNNNTSSAINFQNNTPEELQSLLPIFTELVSLTNKIVTAQENGDVDQVDAATSQLCEKVLKDGQAMGVLGVAMKEMNKHPYPPSLSEGEGGGGGGVAGMNALLQSMSIHNSSSAGIDINSRTIGDTSATATTTSKEELERRISSMQAAQNEAIRKMAALGASMQSATSYQQNQQQEQTQSQNANAPVFSFSFGAGGGGGGRGPSNESTPPMIGPMPPPPPSSFVPSQVMGGVAVPTIPPPPGGWPPNAGPAAAAATAMAAFASSLGYDCSISAATASTATGPTTAYTDPFFQIPIPMMENGGVGGDGSEMLNSAEWLDYFDACLRERGVKGGLVEFEEFARLSNQGAVMTASMTAEGSSMAGGMMGHSQRPMMPQDRAAPLSSRDKDEVDYLPAGFEYDERRYTSDANERALFDQIRASQEAEEEELRTKKAAKKRDKKARQKERAKKEAEVKAALAALKKREKAITSWRSRVVAACSAGDARKMDALVGESPYKSYVYDPTSFRLDEEDEKHDDRPKSQEEYLLKQMEWFLPNCLQKYRTPASSSSELSSTQAQPYANNLAREKLANYILSVSFDIVLQQSPLTHNRNAIHSAAYMGDVDFIQWVIRSQSSKATNDVSYLECLCSDAGWTPLHYATAGGAMNVVELLLQQGVCVTTRTDSSLTCMPSGRGIRAAELSMTLIGGLFDRSLFDRLLCEADILKTIVKSRIENASATDKAAYEKRLRALMTRLLYVQEHGYSPQVENTDEGCHRDLAPPKQKNDKIDNHNILSAATSSNSQTSKKKKKQQLSRANTKTPPPEAIATSTSANSISTSSAIEDEDLTDPVAVALLGMGFTDDQIKSAARALGGFERATADDMVVWILGEGDTAESGKAPDTVHENQAAAQSTPKKVAPRAIVGQKSLASLAEEVARKRQEELAAAKRAAEKREEQRRIRREWNEREQARQMQEKNAKIAEAMTRRQQVENAKLIPETSILPMALESEVGAGVPPSTVYGAPAGATGSGIGKKHQHNTGPPLTIFAGGPKMMASAKPKNVASNMGIPQAPTVLRNPKILTRPLNPPLPVDGASSQPQSLGGVGNQPLFAPSPSLSSNAKASGASPPRNIYAKSIHPSSSNHRNDQPTAILRKGPSAGVANQNINMTNSTRRILPHHPGHYGLEGHAFNDPVSLAASSSMASTAAAPILRHGVAPPGFIPSNSAHHHRMEPSATEEAAGLASSSSFVETNPLGMIRATAREFVPTYFKPSTTSATPDAFLPVPSNTVPSMSAQFMGTRPSTVSPPPFPSTRSVSNDDSENLMFEHMSSLLGTFGAESNTSTVQSVTSSITGPSGVPTNNNNNNNNAGDDTNTTSRVGSIMTFKSTTAPTTTAGGPFAVGGGLGNGIQTSSIFESITYRGDQESNNLALGSGGGIWGTGGGVSSSNVNQNSSLGLAGLNFSSFMGGV